MELSSSSTRTVEQKQSEVRVQLDLLQKELHRNGELKEQFMDRLSSVLRNEPANEVSMDEKDGEELTPLASELRNMVSLIATLNTTWKGIYHTIEL